MKMESGAKRVRAYLDGVAVVDSTHVLLVWERPNYPTYYFPIADVRTDLVPADAYRHVDAPPVELREMVAFTWGAMDQWFEEDEEVYTHARSPYTRVDILPSSRHVRVGIDGVIVAESRRPTLLFETGLPTRYYFAKPDVRLDLLTATDSSTSCPYKGTARYWSMTTGEADYPDIAWAYDYPLPESIRVAGQICFYNERVDIFVDGEREERPHTPFS